MPTTRHIVTLPVGNRPRLPAGPSLWPASRKLHNHDSTDPSTHTTRLNDRFLAQWRDHRVAGRCAGILSRNLAL